MALIPQVLAQQFQLGAQCPHFRDAIQPQQFAPFPRRSVAQWFQRTDARQRHQPQQQEDGSTLAFIELAH
jgi:hypothetical protein